MDLCIPLRIECQFTQTDTRDEIVEYNLKHYVNFAKISAINSVLAKKREHREDYIAYLTSIESSAKISHKVLNIRFLPSLLRDEEWRR